MLLTAADQVKAAAKTVASQLVSLYATNGTNGGYQVVSGIPGLLTYPPYYWWEAGAMFQQLIDYWYYTNDSSYNTLIKEGILHQIGESQNLVSVHVRRSQDDFCPVQSVSRRLR